MSVKVLLIEEEDLVGTMVRMNLEDAGFQVIWKKIPEDPGNAFDVIFLDLDFEGKNGIQILKELRQQSRETPVLAVTGSYETQTKVDALEQGADAFLQKPFEVPEMIARLNALVRRLND